MLSWLGTRDVNQLIARRQYPKAIKELERQLKAKPKSFHLRKLLADVLVRDGRKGRAIEVLDDLVHEYAEEGFLTKAIAVLKKVQRIDPEASEAAEMLSTLLQMKRTVSSPARELAAEPPVPPQPLPPQAVPPQAVPPQAVPPQAVPPQAVPPAPQPTADGPMPAAVPAEAKSAEVFGTSQILLSEVWFDAAAERSDFNWSPLFRDFSKSELAALVGGLRLLVKKPGSIVFSEGEPGESLFVLASGVARVYRRDEKGHNDQIAVLQEGEIFGIPSVLESEGRTATITAIEECELLELKREVFEDIAETFPRIRRQVEELHETRTV